MSRPQKLAADRYRTPVLVVGRVDAITQTRLKAAAAASGKTFTAWALETLVRGIGKPAPLERVAAKTRAAKKRKTKGKS